jgi:transcription antitermination factor NusG
MKTKERASLVLALYMVGALCSSGGGCWGLASSGLVLGTQQPPSPRPAVRPVGTVKAIAGNTITLATDSGPEINVLVQESTMMLRAAPGIKTLNDATRIQLQDLQVGDRILVRGRPSEDAKSVLASAIMVMKRSDIEQKQEQEREDWRKRGVGGLVRSVDAATGTVTLSTSAPGPAKTLVIQISKDTILRRYAPDSVRFDDARPGTLDQIKPGDQLRARGARSSDGAQLTAEEVVSGSFRNISGTISSVDPTRNEISVLDLITKKPVVVKFKANSQLRKLPPMMAQRIAGRLKGQAEGGASGGTPPAGERPAGGAQGGAPPGTSGPSDFQQILSRLPAASLADLQKGDAVMIVSTEGTVGGEVTAITLLSGVEPILTASPSGVQSMVLSPWSLSAPSGEAGTP